MRVVGTYDQTCTGFFEASSDVVGDRLGYRQYRDNPAFQKLLRKLAEKLLPRTPENGTPIQKKQNTGGFRHGRAWERDPGKVATRIWARLGWGNSGGSGTTTTL